MAIIAGDTVTNFYILKVITFTEKSGTGKPTHGTGIRTVVPGLVGVGRGMNGQAYKGSFWTDGSVLLPDTVWVTQVHTTIKTQ